VAEVDAAAWWRAFAVNLYAPFLWSQAVLPGMVARGRGRIINVASRGGLRAIPGASAYFVPKTALIRLSETLAAETRAQGIAVFAIHPGDVRTALSEDLGARPWARAAYPRGPEDPAPDFTPPEAAARLCVALASGRADALSGRYIAVEDDLDQLIARAAEIRAQELYTLRLRT
jgi:NAD(P)-dependent dehydrogenase (short-subunit alcohol dehydrogenase family)